MIEKKPAFACLDRSCTAADLNRLPPFRSFSHYMTMFSPVCHIRAFTEEDIPERCMSAVRRSGKHDIVSVDLSREKNRIPVKWNKRILQSCERFEISCLCKSDRCSVKILTPDQVICIFYFDKTRIICIFRHESLAFSINKVDLFFIKFPVKCVFASSEINKRNTVCLLSTEYSDKFSFIWDNSTVEDSCHTLYRITVDHRVFTVTPERCSCKIFRFILPRHVRHCRTDHFIFTHSDFPPVIG